MAGQLVLSSRRTPFGLAPDGAANDRRHAVACVGWHIGRLHGRSVSWSKRFEAVRLGKAKWPSLLMQRARAGQAIADGRCGRER